METSLLWKLVQTTAKKLFKFTKKIIHVDDMMIHNFVKYLVQTRLRLWDIKITIFKPESCPNDLLEICYFYISQTKSSLDNIFNRVVYHHIIYMCDFLFEFRRLFCHGLHGFSRRLWFPPDTLPYFFFFLYHIKVVAITCKTTSKCSCMNESYIT